MDNRETEIEEIVPEMALVSCFSMAKLAVAAGGLWVGNSVRTYDDSLKAEIVKLAAQMDSEIADWSPANGYLFTEEEQNLQGVTCKGVSTDTRQLQPGDLFVALKGENFDGHDFIQDARNKGAAAVMVSRQVDVEIPQLLVEDTLKGLQNLGHELFLFARRRFRTKSVAITGSNGKTTTKELIAAMLLMHGNVVKTEGNFNNHIGVPLTLCRLRTNTEFAVIEMGASDFGEIEALVKICPADIRVIVSIGEAHLEKLNDLQGVAKAKSEIFSDSNCHTEAVIGCPEVPDLVPSSFVGTLLEVSSTPWIIDINKRRFADRYFWYDVIEGRRGTKRDVLNWKYGDKKENSLTQRMKVISTDLTLIPDYGPHSAENLAVAVAVVLLLAKGRWSAGEALGAQRAEVPSGRGEGHVFKNAGGGKLIVVNDAYNSNPTSLIDSFKHYGQKATAKKADNDYYERIAVIGQMNELGKRAPSIHLEIAEQLVDFNLFDKIYWVGTYAGMMYHATQDAEHCKVEVLESFEDLLSKLPYNGFLYLKASRTLHLEDILSLIQKSPYYEEQAPPHLGL